MKRKQYEIKYQYPFVDVTTFRRLEKWEQNTRWLRISTGGVDIGPDTYFIDETDNFALVYAPSHKSWVGIAMPWEDSPASYYLCRKSVESFKDSKGKDQTADRLHFIVEVEPGPYFAQARRILLEEMVRLQSVWDRGGYTDDKKTREEYVKGGRN